MKTSYPLVHWLRVIFGVGRVLMLIALAFFPLRFLPMPQFRADAMLHFNVDPRQFRVTQDFSSAGGKVQLSALTGTATVSGAAAITDEILSLNRWTVVPTRLMGFAFAFILCELLWRLCRNVERGEIFTDMNLKLVRGLGAAIIIYSIVSGTIKLWCDYRVVRFVLQHASFENLKPVVPKVGAGPFDTLLHFASLDRRFLLTGLLVLVLAEVFRQGLALKQENELTV